VRLVRKAATGPTALVQYLRQITVSGVTIVHQQVGRNQRASGIGQTLGFNKTQGVKTFVVNKLVGDYPNNGCGAILPKNVEPPLLDPNVSGWSRSRMYGHIWHTAQAAPRWFDEGRFRQ